MMKQPFLRVTRLGFALLVLSSLISACASGPQIIVNSDPSTDFSQINTFAFMRPLSTDSGNVTSLLSGQMMQATRAQLEARGMRHDENNPDMLINFLLETSEQLRSRPSSASMSMHRSGRYGMWGGSMSTPTIEQTTQGVLSIDMVNPQRNMLIWEGSATQRVTDNIRNNQAEAVESFVNQILAEFPR